MKLRAICASCGREVSLDGVTSPGPLQGLCPWCGIALAPHNTSRLVEATSRVERSIDELMSSLRSFVQLPLRLRLVTEDLETRMRNEIGP